MTRFRFEYFSFIISAFALSLVSAYFEVLWRDWLCTDVSRFLFSLVACQDQYCHLLLLG